MDWARILKLNGIPEPPGYLETVAKVNGRPKKQKKKPKSKKKA
tara:strand:+ start:726 stop:854 length:129 start_codon:yes stop_codon:yes gene_type:complete